MTIRERGGKPDDRHVDLGKVLEGPFFEDQPDLLRDPAARDVAMAVGMTCR